jgi:hypothetical protein
MGVDRADKIERALTVERVNADLVDRDKPHIEDRQLGMDAQAQR